MQFFIKPHIQKLERYQTSIGRNLDEGIRLDRNEKVSNFTKEEMNRIFSIFKNYSLSASPESLNFYQKIANNLNISIKNIFVTNGITEGIRILYDFCTNPGDNVVCLDPTYPMYRIYADMYDVEFRKISYDNETLVPKISDLNQHLDKKTRFVFLPNPNLPVESCFSINEIKDLANLCRKNNTMLVIDEAYYFFGAHSVMELIHDYENLLIFRTFSKAYGLAGLRIGFMVSQSQNIKYISKSRSLVESNTLSMQIAEYFLDHPEFRDKHIQEVKEGSKFLREKLNLLGLSWYGGEYTNGIMIFLENGKKSQELVKYLNEKGIYIRGSFDPPFESTIRVSIGSRSFMEFFVDSLTKWLKKY